MLQKFINFDKIMILFLCCTTSSNELMNFCRTSRLITCCCYCFLSFSLIFQFSAQWNNVVGVRNTKHKHSVRTTSLFSYHCQDNTIIAHHSNSTWSWSVLASSSSQMRLMCFDQRKIQYHNNKHNLIRVMDKTQAK